jgi:uracil-DNA glycosylase
MDGLAKPDLAEQIAGALDWWREAGVDADFTSEPQRWLPGPDTPAPPAGVAREAEAPEPPPTPALPLPDDLAAFTAWWLTDPALVPDDPARRVAPRGSSGSKAMILVAMPEADDRERLLSSAQGRLLEAICAALGWTEDEIYLASALPAHDPLPDWPGLAAAGLGRIVLHHLSLAAPERVLILGSNVLSLIGHDMANKPRFLPDINHDARKFPVLAELDLAALLAQPRLKAGLWGRLLDWTWSEAT